MSKGDNITVYINHFSSKHNIFNSIEFTNYNEYIRMSN